MAIMLAPHGNRVKSTEPQPLYAKIPHLGGTWSVTHHKTPSITGHGTTTQYLTGYGEFPRDRFPNIPVVDFRGVDDMTPILGIQDCHRPSEANSYYSGTLDTYLGLCNMYGATITPLLSRCLDLPPTTTRPSPEGSAGARRSGPTNGPRNH